MSETLRQLFLASRPISWINTAYPFAAAYLLTVREIDLTLVVGTVFFLIPYNLLMYGINDVFDYESDLRNPRKGGAHGAVLGRRLHRITIVTSIVLSVPFVVWLLVVGNWPSRIVLLISVFFVLAYSVPKLRWKEVPFLDSFTSAVHFVSPAVFGLVLAGAAWNASLALIIAAFMLWGIASHAFGAVQDIAADRAADISSIGTVLGAARTSRFALLAYAAAGLLMLFTAWPGPLAAVLVVPYLLAIWPYRSLSDSDCEQATQGWKRFLWLNQIAGFGVTMLLIWAWNLPAG